MNIAIVGAGNVGATLGRAWAERRHNIIFGVPDPDDGKTQTAVAACAGQARATTVTGLRHAADIIVLATPWIAVEQVLAQLQPFDNEILIDATNPIALGLDGLKAGLIVGHSTSGAEHVARWAPGARAVKAFNTIGAANMSNPLFKEGPASMLICGDDASAKATVMQLARELGFEPEDAGSLTSARMLEPMAMLWIHLAVVEGFGMQFGFKIVRK
jgi:8-hydroxy-5-deazaflavin:NADPH oxidoreductase